MAVETLPVTREILRVSRRTLLLWTLALAGVAALYVGVYPAIGGMDLQSLVEGLPEGMVEALGYDQIGTPAGYISSTVYGLLGPILLAVFAIGTGARLVAGLEENGYLELEFTSPVSRAQVYRERLMALAGSITVLVVVVFVSTYLLVVALGLEVSPVNLVAATAGLWLLVLGFGTLAFATGAATGRRSTGIGVASGMAVIAFMLDAIGPSIEVGWMTAISPFSWYLGGNPLREGFDLTGLLLLAMIPLIATVVGQRVFSRRDLMV